MNDKRSPISRFSDLFNPEERKELLRKYFYFLGWLELLVFVGCWIYQLGSETYDRVGGAVDIPFPWRAYFAISFLAPILITFIIGVVIAGFNRYLTDRGETDGNAAAEEVNQSELVSDAEMKQHRLGRMVRQLQHVPFLGLLLLLGLGVIVLYNLDVIIAVVGSIGEKTVKITVMFVIGILALLSIFAMVLIVLNYRLRKRSMEYRFRSEMADRFGLIILEDNTVLNHEGKLLVQGKKWKKSLPRQDEVTKGDAKAKTTSLAPYTPPPHVSPESAK